MIEPVTIEKEPLLFERRGMVGVITINRPHKRNALSVQAWSELARLAKEADADPQVRCLVITGAGEKAFCSGADISEFGNVRDNPSKALAYKELEDGALRTIQEMSTPTIAMARGFAVGGGLDLATSVDMRIGSEDSMWGIPAAKLGVILHVPETARLVHLVGPAAALELLCTGRFWNAQTAQRMGLVNHVVPGDQLDSFTMELAQSIAENAPLTIACAKGAVRAATRLPYEGLEQLDLFVKIFDSEDFREGRQAFMEKRKPQFKGR